MQTRSRWIFLLLACVAPAAFARGDDGDPLAAWRSGVQVRPVISDASHHSMHSYFNTCPESPDGKWILYFASSAADGQRGDVRIRERVGGTEKVLVKNL